MPDKELNILSTPSTAAMSVIQNSVKGRNPNTPEQPIITDIQDFTGIETFDVSLGEFTSYAVMGENWIWIDSDGNDPGCAFFDDYDVDNDAYLVSNGSYVVPDTAGISLVYDEKDIYPSWYELHQVLITTNFTGDPTTTSWDLLREGVATTAWGEIVIDLSNYVNQGVTIAFRYVGNYADEWFVDNVIIGFSGGPCIVECPPNGIDEGEPDCGQDYVDMYNGGCNSVPEVFQAISPGDIICGISGTFDYQGSDYRDTDWFEYIATSDSALTLTVVAEFPVLIFIIDGTLGCDGLEIISNIDANPCDTVSLTYTPVIGNTYWYWVGPSIFTGYPCPLNYVAILSGGGGGPQETGDTCEDPYLIPESFPYTDNGNTCDYTNYCDIYLSDNSDVIYELTITSSINLEVSLEGSDYDTKLAIYLEDCCSGPDNAWAYNDDFYGLQSAIEATFAPGTYYIVVDGFSTNCGNYIMNIMETAGPNPPACDQQPVGPDGSWNFITSDVEVGPYVVFDNYICGFEFNHIQFWGLDLHYDAAWTECEEDPMTFEIIFYPDNGSTYPDLYNPAGIYSVTPDRINTGIFYGGVFELVEWNITLDESIGLTEGWLSIQGTTNDGAACLFLWGNSEDGDLISYQDQAGTMVLKDTDLARVLTFVTDIDEEVELLPTQFDMLANYPNPFNSKTTISFSLKNSGDVSIEIFDVLGRNVTNIDLGYLSNNIVHSVNYDASNISTGIYFYSLIVDNAKKVTKKFNYLK